ncbi:MAG: hypothetical protein H7836_13475 [Magnetococcus sp. YQC-3]
MPGVAEGSVHLVCLGLTLLVLNNVAAILDGTQPDVLTWWELARGVPMEWVEQRRLWGVG